MTTACSDGRFSMPERAGAFILQKNSGKMKKPPTEEHSVGGELSLN